MPSKKAPAPQAAPQAPDAQAQQIATLVEQVANLAAALDNAESRLKEMGIADPTTGLYSYRYFLGRITEEVARADRFNLEIACIMVGLDRPDFEGLLEVARLLKEHSRVYDIPARWGQHELIALLPATDLDGAQIFAERLRLAVEAACVDHPTVPGLTVSVGITTYPVAGVEDAEGIIQSADHACRAATKAGGNRTVLLGARET